MDGDRGQGERSCCVGFAHEAHGGGRCPKGRTRAAFTVTVTVRIAPGLPAWLCSQPIFCRAAGQPFQCQQAGSMGTFSVPV